MGSSSSKAKNTVGTTTTTNGSSKDSNLLSSFQLAAPTAAVIGAGMAGVHAAYELAKMGFTVSVFEQRGEIAGGSTSASLPFVGVGMLTPALFDMPTWKHLLQGVLWGNYACPNIVLRDALLPSAISPEFHLWLRGRRRCLMNREEIMLYGNGLSRISRQVVQEMIRAHPTLSSYVSPSPVRVLRAKTDTTTMNNEESSSAVVPANTAHDAPVYMDPVGWTRAVAALCEEKYKVQFLTSHRVESLNVRYRNNTEMISSLTYSTPAPFGSSEEARGGGEGGGGWSFWTGTSATHQKQRILSTSAFDVVVLASGGETGALTRNTARLPILNLSSVEVTAAPSSTAAIQKKLGRFFGANSVVSSSSSSSSFSSPPAAVSDKGEHATVTLTEFQPGANVFGYHVPERCVPQGTQSHHSSTTAKGEKVYSSTTSDHSSPTHTQSGSSSEARMCINGLLSTDVTYKSTDASQRQKRKLLKRLSSYLRVFNHIDLPVDMWWDANQADPAAEPEAPTIREYTLGVSPDGLPIVDFYGGFFNSFVCAGFANRNPDWAPGAAVVLRYLVEEQAQTLLMEEREKAKARGIEHHKLPVPTLEKTEQALQQLFAGNLPLDMVSSTRTAASFSGLSQHPSSTSLSFSQTPATEMDCIVKKDLMNTNISAPITTVNPYGTNRFSRGLVPPRSYPDAAPRSPVHMFYLWEDRFVQAVEPWMRSLNQLIVSTAQRDFVPSFIQTAVFCYLYDPDQPSEEERLAAKKLQERMHRVIAAHELKSSSSPELASRPRADEGSSPASRQTKEEERLSPEDWTERSRRSGEEMERQAREFFSGAKVRI